MAKKMKYVAGATPMPALPSESCISCRFYLMPDGLCRRMPPQAVGAATGKKQPDGNPVIAWVTIFPQMQPVGWCGEFRKLGN